MKSEFAAVAVGGVVMGAALLGATDVSAETVAPAHALVLDGVSAGMLRGADATTNGVKIDDVTLTTGTGMSKAFFEWVKTSLKGTLVRKSGEIHALDFQMKSRAIREFRDALITEIAFPTIDGASKDAAYMTLKFSPWIVRNKKGDGTKIDGSSTKQKVFQPTSFHFTFDGCGEPCTKAVKLSEVTVKLAPPPPGAKTGTWHAAPFVVTMPPPADLLKWSATAVARDGALEWLAADGTVLVKVKLVGVKPTRVSVHSEGNRPLAQIELQSDSVVGQ